MSLRGILIGGSFLAHGALLVALGSIRAPEVITATSIEVFETKQPEAPPPPPPVPAKVEPPDPQPAARAPRKAAPAPAEAPQAPAPGLANAPDFGLELGGGGGAGLAVPPPATSAAPRSSAPVAKTLRAPAPKVADACDEGPAKPKLLDLPRPSYTEDARAAGIEGKVRVELTVDETGKVIEVRALTSLGHGLDEAALAAAKSAKFEPALRCGKPSRSTFTISIRFSAS